jgi:hypothetical protein
MVSCSNHIKLSPYDKADKRVASIDITDSFQEDTLTMYINELCVIDNVIISTSQVTSETGYWFSLDKTKGKNAYILNSFRANLSTVFLFQKKKMQVRTTLNGKEQDFIFNLKDGKYLLLKKRADSIDFYQTHKRPAFY